MPEPSLDLDTLRMQIREKNAWMLRGRPMQ